MNGNLRGIVIDAGHGGTDPGSSGNGIIEKDLNLKIAQLMYEKFRDLGVPVKIIRSTDETITPTERVDRVLNAFGNYPNVILLSNHINAGGGDGAEVIYALRNTNQLPDLILEEIGKEGQNIRKAYQRRLPSDPSKDYYFMQRDTGDVQSLTIEYGFLDSPGDDVNQLKNNYPRYVDAVVRAVMEYIGEPIGTPSTYTVKAGDTLWSIAKKFNVTVQELKDENNLTSNSLRVGQVLKIPVEGETEGPSGEIIYIVAPGDSLYSIARKYNTTVDELIRYNNLNSTSLSIGQQIKIPGTSTEPTPPTPVPPETPDYTLYTVKAGDNLYAIARTYNTTVDEIKKLNNLTTNSLSIGQVLRIPSTGGTTPVPPEAPDYTLYTVKAGDNLYAIAQRYNTTVDAIKKLNNLATNSLSIGQVLRIPNAGGTTPETPSTTYVVKAGDNLYAIARTYNTTVEEIKRKNNLTSNTLQIGQVLKI